MNILITGGSGTVGKKLTELLKNNNHQVFWLSRSPEKQKVKSFYWDVEKQEIDVNAFKDIDVIVHLAGASVAGKRWTNEYKKEILDSRIKSTQLLANFLNNNPHGVKKIVSASAIGIYGDSGNKILTENSAYADTFLADVCIQWEAEVEKINNSIQKAILRVGIVLDKNEGALAEIAKPVNFWLGAPLGNGKQIVSWIHVEDLCRMFQYAIENENIKGIYNAVAPKPVSNIFLTNEIAKILKKPCFLPPVPQFILSIIIGEMAAVVLSSQNVSSERIEKAGFTFLYPELKPALEQILVQK
jgi:uncharacterized protein